MYAIRSYYGRTGTVEVSELMVIERYSHVMHIVSNVRGRLLEGRDAFDVFRAAFPAGTLSGAPKIRAMEIIDEADRMFDMGFIKDLRYILRQLPPRITSYNVCYTKLLRLTAEAP